MAIVIPASAAFLGRGRTEARDSEQRTIEAAVSAYYMDPANRRASDGEAQYPTFDGTSGDFGASATATVCHSNEPVLSGSGGPVYTDAWRAQEFTPTSNITAPTVSIYAGWLTSNQPTEALKVALQGDGGPKLTVLTWPVAADRTSLRLRTGSTLRSPAV